VRSPDSRLQRNLLAKTNLTFKEAFESAIAAEAAISRLTRPSSTASIISDFQHPFHDAYAGVLQQVKELPSMWQRTPSCRLPFQGCRMSLLPQERAFSRTVPKQSCRDWSQRGHVFGLSTRQLLTSQRTHQLLEETHIAEDDMAYSMFAVKDEKPVSPYRAIVTVNDKELELEVDTGATSLSSVFQPSTNYGQHTKRYCCRPAIEG
jgi:hypothetical protein